MANFEELLDPVDAFAKADDASVPDDAPQRTEVEPRRTGACRGHRDRISANPLNNERRRCGGTLAPFLHLRSNVVADPAAANGAHQQQNGADASAHGGPFHAASAVRARSIRMG